MKIHIVKNQAEGAIVALNLLREKLANGAKVLGLATGSSPLEFYRLIRESELDFSDVTSVNLDEYVGLDENSDQSYVHFMKENLFNAKPFKQSYLPNGLAEDVAAEAARYNQILSENPVDFQILGIGRNGHIGFNEPGASFYGQTHLVDLAPSTIEANSRFFQTADEVPKQAISMGIANIMAAKTIVLMAYGSEKAGAIKATVEGPVTEEVPASILQKHEDVVLIIDEDAASKFD
ncbi:glucosamine-6-phosphate deaminase [Streptococcus ruminantium]|uniref:Glucosamine-6-phosphate deaminase n=1 Tax=Streptococcus ruminantium TaxID=1917441 RepID=A0ABU1B5K7_9STRE|nr:glucosamine-6-phosphate deaminase [Streptococcus ruminantium]MDQ8759412.1 glucosamine-6-phosphate deaminase [Streptococcus ruminantium]MDQ8765819.1 glucosamine-6-phosphate deaminase [Streptococcus ruminantium]MDQ8767515.1 glucosamine-6-phosphate deaminase [Streptococcus ruminantium]MDQ8769493.1 glucosamine-6-phosphate deaminase [Streptococcus ruminantium]MDQ8775326.1 glucosamine-6-phosphate deaminase [Streptococcus ruminantium]